jgi:hypothetical protein
MAIRTLHLDCGSTGVSAGRRFWIHERIPRRVNPRLAVFGLFDGAADVKVMDLAAPGVWTSLGPGLPNTLIYELDDDPNDDVMVAGTMGRGAWIFDIGCSPGSQTPWYRDVDGVGELTAGGTPVPRVVQACP